MIFKVALCYGREDPWVVPLWGQRLKRVIKNATYYELSPSGHCPNDETPEAVKRSRSVASRPVVFEYDDDVCSEDVTKTNRRRLDRVSRRVAQERLREGRLLERYVRLEVVVLVVCVISEERTCNIYNTNSNTATISKTVQLSSTFPFAPLFSLCE